MTETLLAILVVLLTVMVTLIGVLVWYQWRSSMPPAPEAPERPQERPAPPTPTSTPPMPFDDSNPPSWRVYRPRPGAAPLACSCHPDRLLVPDQNVLWWPSSEGDGVVVLFCEDGVREFGGDHR